MEGRQEGRKGTKERKVFFGSLLLLCLLPFILLLPSLPSSSPVLPLAFLVSLSLSTCPACLSSFPPSFLSAFLRFPLHSFPPSVPPYPRRGQSSWMFGGSKELVSGRIPSFLPSFLPSFFLSFLSSFMPSFLLPSLLPSFLPSFLLSFFPSFLPSCLPSSFLPCFLPAFLASYREGNIS